MRCSKMTHRDGMSQRGGAGYPDGVGGAQSQLLPLPGSESSQVSAVREAS